MNTYVAPVLNKPVQVFKKPPKYGAYGKKEQEKSGAIDQHAMPGSSIAQGINYQDE